VIKAQRGESTSRPDRFTSEKEVEVPSNRPESPMRGRDIAILFLDLGTRRGWVVSITPRPLYHEKGPAPIVQEAEWAPGPV
jgi:hypothetical protein